MRLEVAVILSTVCTSIAFAKPSEGREGRQASEIIKSLSSSLFYIFGSNAEAIEDMASQSQSETNYDNSESPANENAYQEQPHLEKRILRSGSSEQLSEGMKPNQGQLQTKSQKPKSKRPPLYERVSLGNQKTDPIFIGPRAPNPERRGIHKPSPKQHLAVGGSPRPSKVQHGPLRPRAGPSTESSSVIPVQRPSRPQAAADLEGRSVPGRGLAGVYEARADGGGGLGSGKVRQSQVQQAENQEDFRSQLDNKETGPSTTSPPSTISLLEKKPRTGSDASTSSRRQLGTRTSSLNGATSPATIPAAQIATSDDGETANPATTTPTTKKSTSDDAVTTTLVSSTAQLDSVLPLLVASTASPTIPPTASTRSLTNIKPPAALQTTSSSEKEKIKRVFSPLPLPSPRLNLVLGQPQERYVPSSISNGILAQADETHSPSSASNVQAQETHLRNSISNGIFVQADETHPPSPILKEVHEIQGIKGFERESQHQYERMSLLPPQLNTGSSASAPLPSSTGTLSMATVMGAIVGALALLLLFLGIFVFFLLLQRPTEIFAKKAKEKRAVVPSRPLPPAPSSNQFSPADDLVEDHQSSGSSIFLPSSDEPDVNVISSVPTPTPSWNVISSLPTPAPSLRSPHPLQFVPLNRIYSNNASFATSSTGSMANLPAFSPHPTSKPEHDLDFYASSSCSSCLAPPTRPQSTLQSPPPSLSRISSTTPTISMLRTINQTPSFYSSRSPPRSWVGVNQLPTSPQPSRPLPPTPTCLRSKSMDNLDEIYALRRSSENVDMKQPTYINSTNLNKSYTIIDDSSGEGNYEEGDYGWENDRMESKYCQVTRVREGLQQRLGSFMEEEKSRETPLLVIEQEEKLSEDKREHAMEREKSLVEENNQALVMEKERQLFEKRQVLNREESPIYNEVSDDSGTVSEDEVLIKKKSEKEETDNVTHLSIREETSLVQKEKKLSDSYWILPKVEVVQFGEPVWDQTDLDNELD